MAWPWWTMFFKWNDGMQVWSRVNHGQMLIAIFSQSWSSLMVYPIIWPRSEHCWAWSLTGPLKLKKNYSMKLGIYAQGSLKWINFVIYNIILTLRGKGGGGGCSWYDIFQFFKSKPRKCWPVRNCALIISRWLQYKCSHEIHAHACSSPSGMREHGWPCSLIGSLQFKKNYNMKLGLNFVLYNVILTLRGGGGGGVSLYDVFQFFMSKPRKCWPVRNLALIISR